MSLAYPAGRRAAPILSRGCWAPVALTWLGIGLGLVAFGSSVMAAPPLERRVFAVAMTPTPDQITAYTVALCGAMVTVVNTALMIWHKVAEPRRPRRKRRKSEPKSGETPK